ncbi:MAG: histidine phosphotransferase family protein [Pseudomonadota bacterium]
MTQAAAPALVLEEAEPLSTLVAPAADTRLAALLGSRICHDLISPVGAIGNGLELMREIGGPRSAHGAELELIGRSADAAAAVLQLYRLAFGAASPTERTPRAAARRVMARWMVHQRADLDWPDDRGAEDLPRAAARLLCNMVQIGVALLPRGGLVRVEQADDVGALRVRAEGQTGALPENAAAWLDGEAPAPDPSPREVHLALAGRHAVEAGVRLGVSLGEGMVTLTTAPR